MTSIGKRAANDQDADGADRGGDRKAEKEPTQKVERIHGQIVATGGML